MRPQGIEVLELVRGAQAPTLSSWTSNYLTSSAGSVLQIRTLPGLEVKKWIKEDDALKAIPTIAVTTFAMKGDEETILEDGCDAHLAKPMSIIKFSHRRVVFELVPPASA